MNPRILSIALYILFTVFFSPSTQGQNFGTIASAVWLTDCSQSNYFNTSGSGGNLIGPSGNSFTNSNLGVHTQNSSSLVLRGAEVRTSKNVGSGNVCGARLFYRIYLQTALPGAFNTIDLPLSDNCNVPANQYPSGGSCLAGEQKWNRVIPNGTTTPYSPINLTAFAPGNYVLEVYYDVAGSNSSTTLCDETIVLNNGGTNYKAFFTIQDPGLLSNNPTTCNGNDGSITVNGLKPGVTYSIIYSDDGTDVGPANYVANSSGEVIFTGLNAGVYANFNLTTGGCSTDLFSGQVLSNPVVTAIFTRIPPFCAGSTAPLLPTTSNNGITGTWNPAVIDNQNSGSYTFTPNPGQCAISGSLNVTVKPNLTPTFSFGTSLSICAGASVPALPTTSTNSISGTWSPSTIDNQASATYTFTPSSGQCAVPTSLSVTVNPNITPIFSFGTSLTICEGTTAPLLPTTSDNNITGTWSPSSIDNQASGTYNFTPAAGLCATTTTLSVTVNPNITPTFSFGTSLTICAGGTVPALPGTSTNGISGTWNPAVADNQNSGTYTFTPSTAGQCYLPASFAVTVNPNVTPAFSFGTALTICEGSPVPTLSTTSTNNITGTWSPSSIDNQTSGTYTFTPTAGQCATTTALTVTVNPNITPTFSFGTSLSICEGASAPSLPTSSTNSITGTWSPSAIDNQASATYTFTPTAGQCATTASLTVTVNPNITPTFSFGTSLTICEGAGVPTLSTTSSNNITGTWSPSAIDNQASGTYTFTPTAGQCATTTVLSVTVNPNITPTFSFGTSLTICDGAAVPSLPASSSNSITGTWSPSTINNQSSGTYTFTPTAGQCATTTALTVTVNPNITPAFSFGTALAICEGGTAPSLPTTSTNNITGTWSPSTVDNQTSGTYTFTPTAGQCATTTSLSVTVSSSITPAFSFGTSLTICQGESVPVLPTTSTNGVSGTWNPSTVSNQNSGTYTFTPNVGQCAINATFTVTVNPSIQSTFSFGTSLTICDGGSVPTLPTTSSNGIAGSWNPSVVSNQNSGTYTFTPSTAGQCYLPASFAVTVNPNVTPAFSFGTALTICEGSPVPTLSTTSTNNITGTWSPSSVDNQASGTYTFTPTAGQCAVSTTLTVTVNPNITPAFSFGTSLTICAGEAVPSLPGTSSNGITGTWNPATVSNQNSGTYTFTPDAGLCATTATFMVTVNPIVTPAFSFGTALSICDGATAPTLPATSTNNINGTWSPSTIDNQASGTYTFTPTGGQCGVPVSLNVTVNPVVTPTFSFGTDLTICSGTTVPSLPVTSSNNVTGTWNPAIVSNQNSATYTFTPAQGECATVTTFTVTVTPSVTSTFDFGTELTICEGETVPTLVTTSSEGKDGVWNPAIVDNMTSGTYTFTPTATPEQCILPAIFTVTVNKKVTPTFNFGSAMQACSGTTMPLLPTTSTNGVNGTWNPSIISNQVSGTYTFTTTAGQCATATYELSVTINPLGSVVVNSDTTVNDGTIIPATNFVSTPADVIFTWVNPNSSIGLQSSGTGNVPSFMALNKTASPVSSTITVTPILNGCAGTTRSYTITVNPLDKDVFVPNVFTPNADGKNDKLFVYSNYINKVEMRIFNQWGEQVEFINNTTRGWDGTYKGKPQPVGVYVYTLKAVLVDGRTINLKGSITLLR